jgi:hypothetical protein
MAGDAAPPLLGNAKSEPPRILRQLHRSRSAERLQNGRARQLQAGVDSNPLCVLRPVLAESGGFPQQNMSVLAVSPDRLSLGGAGDRGIKRAEKNKKHNKINAAARFLKKSIPHLAVQVKRIYSYNQKGSCRVDSTSGTRPSLEQNKHICRAGHVRAQGAARRHAARGGD